VREKEIFRGDLLIVHPNEVEIDDPRFPTLAADSAELLVNLLDPVEKGQGGQSSSKGERTVLIARGVGPAADRTGVVERTRA
jgi:hypothetical protein